MNSPKEEREREKKIYIHVCEHCVNSVYDVYLLLVAYATCLEEEEEEEMLVIHACIRKMIDFLTKEPPNS